MSTWLPFLTTGWIGNHRPLQKPIKRLPPQHHFQRPTEPRWTNTARTTRTTATSSLPSSIALGGTSTEDLSRLPRRNRRGHFPRRPLPAAAAARTRPTMITTTRLSFRDGGEGIVTSGSPRTPSLRVRSSRTPGSTWPRSCPGSGQLGTPWKCWGQITVIHPSLDSETKTETPYFIMYFRVRVASRVMLEKNNATSFSTTLVLIFMGQHN